MSEPNEKVGDIAAEAGIRRVHVVAWRDVDDPEAGGSESHAAELCRRWAAAGLDVTVRTSHAAGHPAEIERDGYRVTRRAGRYLVFPRAAATGLAHAGDALVEIWNGMPFFSPLWHRGPRLTLLHHVHGEMWDMVLPPRLATLGRTIESRIAPLVYRRSQIATLSTSSKATICRDLGLRSDRVAVVPPGVDSRFSPGGDRAPNPLVVVVGRLMPSKRVPELVHSLAAARHRMPDLALEIVGEGYERGAVESAIGDVDGGGWISLTGHLPVDALVDLYRRAWLLVSASSHEGWGMTITEAGACGTPAVVTDIAGHRDAVVDGATGVLSPDPAALGPAIADLVIDAQRRRDLGAAARRHATGFTWDHTAATLMGLLASTARRRSQT